MQLLIGSEPARLPTCCMHLLLNVCSLCLPQLNQACIACLGYPEHYLARCKLPKPAVLQLISQALRQCPPSTPLPEVHSLRQQLYVVLYFVPEALHGDHQLMAAVVGKLFRANWVVPWAPGHLADVSLQWHPYRCCICTPHLVCNQTALHTIKLCLQ